MDQGLLVAAEKPVRIPASFMSATENISLLAQGLSHQTRQRPHCLSKPISLYTSIGEKKNLWVNRSKRFLCGGGF